MDLHWSHSFYFVLVVRCALPLLDYDQHTPKRSVPLLDIDGGENDFVEPQTRGDADCTHEQPEGQTGQRHVPKVHNVGGWRIGFELLEIHDRVHEDVQGGRTAVSERTPPPMVILAAKLKVHAEEGDLGARYEQNEKDEQEKAKVVEVEIHPDAGHDVVQFNETRPKGEDATDEQCEGQVHVPRLGRYLARDGRSFDGEHDRHLAETHECAGKDQRSGNAKPQEKKHEDGHKWHRAATLVKPSNQVHEEEQGKGNAGKGQGGQKRRALPRLALEGLV